MHTKPQQSEIPTAKNSVPTSALRRSKRVILDLPLVIRGEGEDKRPFQEETFTIKVSAHGGLVVLGNRVAVGQKVVLMNPKTGMSARAQLSFLDHLMRASPQWGSNSLNLLLSFGRLVVLRGIGISLSLTSRRLTHPLRPPRHGLALHAVQQNTMRSFEFPQFRLPELNRLGFLTTTADEIDKVVRFIEMGRRGKLDLP